MAVTYADSGMGWIADEEYFAYDPGAICTILGLTYRKTSTGSMVYATVYLPSRGTTGPVVLSTVSTYAEYTDGAAKVMSQGTLDYIGRTWYITAFTGWQQGDQSDTSGLSHKLTVASTSLYDIGAAILDAASVTRKPRDPTQKTNFQIVYNGTSKVIKRICERINNVALLGVEHTEAFYGDWGNEAYQHSKVTSGNPHNVTLGDLGIEYLPRQVSMILEAIGGDNDNWWNHETLGDDPVLMEDHTGDALILRSTGRLLLWH